MAAIVDPNLLSQLDAPDPSAPGAPGPAAAQPGAPAPLTVHPSGPVTDPQVLKALNDAPDDPTPQGSTQEAQSQGWGDWARGAGNAMVHGANATLGMFGDVGNAAEMGATKALVYGADKLGLIPNGKHYSDFVNEIQNDPKLNAAPQGALANIESASGLSSQGLQTAEQGAMGPLPAPQTPAGQMVDRTGSFMPMAVTMGLGGGFGGVMRSVVANGALPAAGSEVGGKVGNVVAGDAGETAGRLLGGGAGGMLGGAAVSTSPLDHMLSGASRGASDADIQAAHELMQRNAAVGIQTTPAEAIQQITGGATGMGKLQRHAENMSESQPIMAPYFAQRPAQVDQAARGVFDQISPQIADPNQLVVQAQNEAGGAMRQVRNERANGPNGNDGTTAAYAAAANDTVPAHHVAGLLQRIDQQIAQNPTNRELTAPLLDIRQSLIAHPGSPGAPATPGTPPGRVAVTDPNTGTFIRWQPTPGTPGTPAVPPTPPTLVTNVGQLGNLYKTYRDMYGGGPVLGETGAAATARNNANQIVGALRGTLRQHSPAWQAANDLHAAVTAQEVAPRQIGPIGQIEQTSDLQGMGNTLYPSNPNMGQENVTADAVRRMPDNTPAITRNHLETQFNEATQQNIPGMNQWGGAKYAAQIAGNPQQEATLHAGISALPNGPALEPRVRMLLDAMRTTGQRERPGSMTAYNEHDIAGMEKGPRIMEALTTALSPVKAGEMVSDAYQRYRIGQNAEALAHVLSSGQDGMDRIIAARQSIPPDQYRSLLAQAIMQRSALPALIGASTGPSGSGSR